MKLLKVLLVVFSAFNFAYARDEVKVLAIPYSFAIESGEELTMSKFLAYACEYKYAATMHEVIGALFKVAKDDDSLAKALTKPEDLALAKKILANLGDLSSLKASYVIEIPNYMLVLLSNSFMLFDKAGKWELSTPSPLYTYLAKNAPKGEFLKKNPKRTKKIELFDANLEPVTLKDANSLARHSAFDMYLEAYDAFYSKNFESFSVHLDDSSLDTFLEKVGENSNEEEVAKSLAVELNTNRDYIGVFKLDACYVVFFNESIGAAKSKKLKFEFFRDMGCNVEIINYGKALDPIMLDFLLSQAP